MSDTVLVVKDEEHQRPIPTEWRRTLVEVIEAFKKGDFCLNVGVPGVHAIKFDDAERIERNIENYGAQLISLPEETWGTSACQWMSGYWDLLIDLYTVEEGSSDLVLAVRVYEGTNENIYLFEVQSVYVP